MYLFTVGQWTPSIIKERVEVYCLNQGSTHRLVQCRLTVQSSNRNDISREFKDIIGENVSTHLDKLKSEVHLIEDDIKQAVTEMSKFRLIKGLNLSDGLAYVGDSPAGTNLSPSKSHQHYCSRFRYTYF